MSLVDPPDVMEQGLWGLTPLARVGGTGSVSTLSIDEEEAKQAAKRRGPLGFAPPEDQNARVERELRNVGECLWTARDVLSVVQTNDGRLEVRYA